MFTDIQKGELAADLRKAHVRHRSQGGRQLAYVEAWHAIAEANRIFGFDGWTRETVELKCVTERERTIGSGGQGWGVTYIAKVRVTAGGIVREGCGAGHGIDRDLGQAHESALKESESDAMKRALMTFGNPFGLALYDKEQAGVADDEPDSAPPRRTPSSVDDTTFRASSPNTPLAPEQDAKRKLAEAYARGAKIALQHARNEKELTKWVNDESDNRAKYNIVLGQGTLGKDLYEEIETHRAQLRVQILNAG